MTLGSTQINLHEVVQEVTRIFLDYESALMRNDVDALNAYFWRHQAVTRYGICDKQLGHDALVAYRAKVPAPDFTRALHDVRITAFGPDMAVAMCEFKRSDTDLHGFQTQTWVRMPEGWRIVSAHVSMVPFQSTASP
ncbi:MAG: oxalurate catabolism protein HpxZ [Aquabacterium sp.]|uniref:oxalurate catabolism protein HpxZ n=1 Tax=Aquabacterium sp. TaxID=1872578 RepID=UPI001208FC89|nr:oxalurate catabolism protein HpxZ [Aquabacterium sp.]TAK94811.1 MAG: oxalurate catabolism protein HpxZ [Aquabacterium sp.]